MSRGSRELAKIDAARERLDRRPERFDRGEERGCEIPGERVELISYARSWHRTAT